MSRLPGVWGSVFICYRRLVSAKLTNQSRKKGRLNTVAFLSADNKRCSTESDAYVLRTAPPTGVSGDHTTKPMQTPAKRHESRRTGGRE